MEAFHRCNHTCRNLVGVREMMADIQHSWTGEAHYSLRKPDDHHKIMLGVGSWKPPTLIRSLFEL